MYVRVILTIFWFLFLGNTFGQKKDTFYLIRSGHAKINEYSNSITVSYFPSPGIYLCKKNDISKKMFVRIGMCMYPELVKEKKYSKIKYSGEVFDTFKVKSRTIIDSTDYPSERYFVTNANYYIEEKDTLENYALLIKEIIIKRKRFFRYKGGYKDGLWVIRKARVIGFAKNPKGFKKIDQYKVCIENPND